MMVKELAALAVVSTVNQVHPLFSFSENSRFKAGRNLDWYALTAVLADGPLTDEALRPMPGCQHLVLLAFHLEPALLLSRHWCSQRGAF